MVSFSMLLPLQAISKSMQFFILSSYFLGQRTQ